MKCWLIVPVTCLVLGGCAAKASPVSITSSPAPSPSVPATTEFDVLKQLTDLVVTQGDAITKLSNRVKTLEDQPVSGDSSDIQTLQDQVAKLEAFVQCVKTARLINSSDRFC